MLLLCEKGNFNAITALQLRHWIAVVLSVLSTLARKMELFYVARRKACRWLKGNE